jgi:hypothetical protein
LAEKIGILAFQPISSKFNWKVIVEMAKGKEDFKFVANLLWIQFEDARCLSILNKQNLKKNSSFGVPFIFY